MNITKTPLEDVCKYLLQKTVSIEIGNKVLKHGKIILFYQKNFYLTFLMDTVKKKREKVEIPIPYEVELHDKDGLVFFDYRLKTLAKHAPEIEDYLRIYSSKNTANKFWNIILTIDTNEK